MKLLLKFNEELETFRDKQKIKNSLLTWFPLKNSFRKVLSQRKRELKLRLNKQGRFIREKPNENNIFYITQ